MVPKPRNQCTKDSGKLNTGGQQAERVRDVKKVFDDNDKYASSKF